MTTLHVLFKIAASEYALPASDVLHMESFSGATPVPGAPAYVKGIVQVRGRVIPVVDLRSRFGLQTGDSSPDARVIVVERHGRAVGLLADSAREVVKLDTDEFRAAPELLADSGAGFVKSVAQRGGRLILLLDLQKVIGEEVDADQRNA